ncbi:MAG: thioredoxin fold domain-containing protein [Candidatus Competibacteraceae bacterium]
MVRSLKLFGSLVLFVLIVVVLGMSFLALVAPVGAGRDAFFGPAPDNLQGALAQATQMGKRGVLVLFELQGCGECRKLKDTVLRDPTVRDFYQRHFLSVSLNLTSAAPLVDFKGNTSKQIEFALANRVQVAPTFIFFDATGEPVTRFAGPVKDAGEFLQLGRYVAEAAYENAPFRVYQFQHGVR